jgi:hypothetical protein
MPNAVERLLTTLPVLQLSLKCRQSTLEATIQESRVRPQLSRPWILFKSKSNFVTLKQDQRWQTCQAMLANRNFDRHSPSAAAKGLDSFYPPTDPNVVSVIDRANKTAPSKIFQVKLFKTGEA